MCVSRLFRLAMMVLVSVWLMPAQAEGLAT